MWSIRAELNSLEDYAIIVQNASKKNLDLAIQDANAKLIGLGTSRSVDEEVVLLSSTAHQTVTMHVVNTAQVPVNFDIALYKIRW